MRQLRYMNMRQKISKDFLKIIFIFLGWRFFLILCTIVAINFIPQGSTDRFLGGGPINYQISPGFFGWANYDGEHYLSIAIFGYKGLEQAFFPVYPAFISFFSKPFSADIFSALLSSTFIGIILSNFSLLLAIILLWELVKIDYPSKIAFGTIVALLVFPTSFYFGAVYSESLFLLLAVASFYFARKRNWFLASFLGALSSATRVFGILLLPALIIEAWQQKASLKKSFWIFIIPLGLLGYMIYQWNLVGDPLAFYKLQENVGEQRQLGITLLPQVFYRYIKMLITINSSNPIYQTLYLEFIVGIVFFLLPVYGFLKKIRFSYIFFALFGFLIPSITGSFSSMPRYVIIFFPSFIALALLIDKLPKLVKVIIVIISLIILGFETSLYLRGYWVA